MKMARVLIVEDNEKNGRLLRLVLTSKGHEILDAGNLPQ